MLENICSYAFFFRFSSRINWWSHSILLCVPWKSLNQKQKRIWAKYVVVHCSGVIELEILEEETLQKQFEIAETFNSYLEVPHFGGSIYSDSELLQPGAWEWIVPVINANVVHVVEFQAVKSVYLAERLWSLGIDFVNKIPKWSRESSLNNYEKFTDVLVTLI